MEIAFLVRHLASWLLLVATAGVAGELLLARSTAVRAAELRALAPALGLVALGNLFGLLGLAGRLTQPAVVAGIVAIHLAGWKTWRRIALFLGVARGAGEATAGGSTLPRRRLGAWAVAGGVLLTPLFALALYPPSAFDETLYHLPVARAFAATGGLPFLPEVRTPVFPQLAEVLSAALLLVADDVATHFVALLANLLTAGVLAVWAGARFGAATGGLAALIWLGNPIVTYLGGTGYVEPLLALFVTTACWALSQWRATGGRAWLVLAAVFAASAADVKYLGLFFVAALAAAVLLPPPSQADAAVGGRGVRGRALALFAAVAAAVLLPWYGRIVAWTGNPVFPFLPEIFGETAWNVPVQDLSGLSLGADLASWVEVLRHYFARLLPVSWDVVLRRTRVGQMPPFSPLYLISVPLIAFTALRDRRTRAAAALGAAYCLLFPLLPADSRYLVPVLPLFSLVMAVGIAAGLTSAIRRLRLPARRQRTTGLALALLLSSPGWLYASYRLSRLGPLPTTPGARSAHLARLLPVYPAVERLDAELVPGERVYLLYAEEMRYHVRGEVVGDWSGPDNYREIGPLLADPGALARRLRARGVRYLLVGKTRTPLPPRERAPWPENFRLLYEDPAAALYALRGDA